MIKSPGDLRSKCNESVTGYGFKPPSRTLSLFAIVGITGIIRPSHLLAADFQFYDYYLFIIHITFTFTLPLTYFTLVYMYHEMVLYLLFFCCCCLLICDRI